MRQQKLTYKAQPHYPLVRKREKCSVSRLLLLFAVLVSPILSAFTTDGGGTIDQHLTVNGDTILGDASGDTTTVKGPITAENNLTVDAVTTLKGNTILGDAVGDTTTVKGPITAENNLTVNAVTTLKGNTILGDASGDTTTVKGPITAENNLTVNGNATLGDATSDTIIVTGSLSIGSVDDSTGIVTSTETFIVDNTKIPTVAAVAKHMSLHIVYIEKYGGTTTNGVDARIEKCKTENGYLASIGELVNIFKNKDTFPVKSGVIWPTDSNMNYVVSATPALIVDAAEEGVVSDLGHDHYGQNFVGSISTTINTNWGVQFSGGAPYTGANRSGTTDGFICLGPIYYSN